MTDCRADMKVKKSQPKQRGVGTGNWVRRRDGQGKNQGSETSRGARDDPGDRTEKQERTQNLRKGVKRAMETGREKRRAQMGEGCAGGEVETGRARPKATEQYHSRAAKTHAK